MIGFVAIIFAYFAASFASKSIQSLSIGKYPSLHVRGGARIDGLPSLPSSEEDESENDNVNEVNEGFIPSDEEDDEQYNNGPSANLPYMITNRMRFTLENDLGYLSDEVDEMEPQIATVVISRNLIRPSRGMPSSWRRSDSSSGTNPIVLIGNLLQSFSKQFISATRASSKIVLPVMGATAIILLGRQVSKIQVRIPFPKWNFSFLTLQKKRNERRGKGSKSYHSPVVKNKREPKREAKKSFAQKDDNKRVNLKYLEQLHTPSFIDSSMLKSKTLRRQRV